MFKLRNLVILALGVLLGYKAAAKMREDDPDILHGPQRTNSSQSPGLRLVQGQAQRLADQATGRSLAAIRRTRGAIRARLGEHDDQSAWN
ncbi:MAG: hypothetical protein QOG88_547 [Actinomycetota bacterium]|jgi:hypothetical protein|nr:hypothetical protein [Actinomycetota bacterium]